MTSVVRFLVQSVVEGDSIFNAPLRSTCDSPNAASALVEHVEARPRLASGRHIVEVWEPRQAGGRGRLHLRGIIETRNREVVSLEATHALTDSGLVTLVPR